MSDLKKRSVIVSGHKTSVSLETPFWEELSRIASDRDQSVSTLISTIDKTRTGNLSSALRLFVLDELRHRLSVRLP
ncbi:MAG: ribbon-helix-helix domain-containing protein [Rhodospirillaceae bacterium]|jgi:predicted DNA-binding ribbon-helix-helix protein|nr:ribbon-helix-helix domain-containing protein [Rhodospirillaceae bacterium]MBT5458023.1 ribbon-helix-helix domain-containing protein [Rhodospirillaceae bacterium]